ncbi:MAG TPA: hypothetical protein VHC49_11325 [Mycobacteriales bacterium]|nr:hypothetical protein [Mycobacteriales bacterium]
MADPDLAPLCEAPWLRADHRTVRAHLEGLGWNQCGVGDWAYAYRSPGGALIARVSPFEPAYGYFVDLCRRCAGNRHVPRIEIATPLEGGGHLTVMEYLGPPDPADAEEFLERWPDDADEDISRLRREIDAMDTWGRQNVRWWGKVDLGARHVLRSSDGALKLIDLFFVTWELVDELICDPRAFAHHMTIDRCRYLLDLPDLQDDSNSPERLARIRNALAQLAAESPA